MPLKKLSIISIFTLLGSVSAYATCTSSPSGKTYSGSMSDVLYYETTDKKSMSQIWGRRWAVRMTFNATGSTVTITGYAIAGGDGGSAISINTTTTTYKATWTFDSTTCSGTIAVAPRTGATTNNTYNVFYQLASSGAVINTVNKNTPSSIFTQTTGSTTTIVGGGTLWQE